MRCSSYFLVIKQYPRDIHIGKIFVSLQEFCEHGERWPPLSEMQLFMGEAGKSCVEVCKLTGKFYWCVIKLFSVSWNDISY